MPEQENIIKIKQPIKSFKVVDKEKEKKEKIEKEVENIVMMSEKVKRPEMLIGSTYKIKNPTEEHAMYVTINDVLLNEGTNHEMRRPFEIFINSKNMDNFQWVVALTRVISSVFRKGGDVAFLVDELRSVFDPKGGYFKKGDFIPSLIAEIGITIEKHLKTIGVIQVEEMPEHQKAILEEKKKEYIATQNQNNKQNIEKAESVPNGMLCAKCHNNTVIIMDGCKTCLNCGDSKCS